MRPLHRITPSFGALFVIYLLFVQEKQEGKSGALVPLGATDDIAAELLYYLLANV